MQMPSKPIGFVAASPPCVFQDGEGIFLFTLARYLMEFFTGDRQRHTGVELPRDCSDCVL